MILRTALGFAVLLPAPVWAQTSALPSADQTAAANTEEPKICKRFVETGTLAKRVKLCLTQREWDRNRANVQTTHVGSGSCPNANVSC